LNHIEENHPIRRYLLGGEKDLYVGVKDTGIRKMLDLQGGGEHEVGFWHVHRDKVDYVFVDHLSYHRPGNPYGNRIGPYADNLFRCRGREGRRGKRYQLQTNSAKAQGALFYAGKHPIVRICRTQREESKTGLKFFYR
jgi:hypothetical protein